MRKHLVSLSEEQREYVRRMISAGEAPARQQAHARVLLKADQGDADVIRSAGGHCSSYAGTQPAGV